MPGIIPALAGNTQPCWPGMFSGRDHPRSRGEYINTLRANGSFDGSSPLSRGILPPQVRHILTSRIIPALAGNTRELVPHTATHSDHPRSRGEYQPSVSGQLGGNGSSPLSRGIRHSGASGSGRHEDHPRSRGEYHMVPSLRITPIGSSPLSRGIRPMMQLCEILARIIPALAGNTSRVVTVRTALWDHPRSRGEYPCRPEESFNASGSSPLSRGIQSVSVAGGDGPGIIPALAGNTTHLSG